VTFTPGSSTPLFTARSDAGSVLDEAEAHTSLTLSTASHELASAGSPECAPVAEALEQGPPLEVLGEERAHVRRVAAQHALEEAAAQSTARGHQRQRHGEEQRPQRER
jgi:hypothetical protein